MNKLIIFIVVICILQTFLRYMHINYYNKSIKEICSKYKSGYFGLGLNRNHIFKKNIFVLVIDCNGIIKDALVLSGITVFSRFKRVEQLIGLNMKEVKETKIYWKYKTSIDSAYDQILNQIKNNQGELA